MTATRFLDGGARKPRHVICFSSPHEWVSRTVLHDANGRPRIVCEAGDITTVRIDLSNLLESGEDIVDVINTESGVTSGIIYESPYVYVTVQDPACQGAHVYLDIMTSLNERYTFRLMVDLPKRRNEPRRISSRAFDRGTIDGAPASVGSYTPPADSFDVEWDGVEW